jgi:hypothetical protein
MARTTAMNRTTGDTGVAPVGWPLLRALAGFRAQEGIAISLFLDLDPSDTPVRHTAASRLRSLRDRVHQQAEELELPHAQKVAVRADLERIDGWWQHRFEHDGALGFALFVSSLDDLWRELPLAAVVPDDAGLGARLRLLPLVEPAGNDHEGALVAVVSKERGRILELRGGRLEEVDARYEERADALHGGWARPEHEHHLEMIVHRHLKAVAAEINRRVHAAKGCELALIVPEELRGELEAALSGEARGAIVGWARADDDATPAELLELVQPLLAESRRRRLVDDIERWRAARGRGGPATAGWEDTLEACAEGRVELLLLWRNGTRSAWRCPRCERPDANAGVCVLHGNTLVPDDGVELAIRTTVTYGGTVELIEEDDLEAPDGIAALLRF